MASRGINKVILVGRLGQNPEVNATPSGTSVTNVSLATSESWTDRRSGNTQETTEWHRVVFFGPLADIAGAHLGKGSQIYVEGKNKTRKWKDKQGVERYSTEVVVDSFTGVLQMLGGRQEAQQQAPAPNNSPTNDSFDDDIPF